MPTSPIAAFRLVKPLSFGTHFLCHPGTPSSLAYPGKGNNPCIGNLTLQKSDFDTTENSGQDVGAHRNHSPENAA